MPDGCLRGWLHCRHRRACALVQAVSEAAPEGGRPRGGGALSRPVGGIPLWGWIVVIGAGGGALLWFKLRGSAGSTSTATDTTAAGSATDDTTGTSEYEQISAQLTGIEGTNEALLASIKDLQGDDTGTTGGAGKVKVPDIVGERGSAARAKISAAGLKYKQEPAKTPRGRETEVTSQAPHAGTEVAKGAEVTAQVKVRAESGKSSGGAPDSSSGGGGTGGSSPASGSSAAGAGRPATPAAKAAAKAPTSPPTKAPTKSPARTVVKSPVKAPARGKK